MPDLSVVVCTHNRATTLERCLPHLLNAIDDAAFPCELIVVDNGSTDATPEVLNRLQAHRPFRVVHEPRLGHAIALNAGWRAASGAIVAFTDDDALPRPAWLARIHQDILGGAADWAFGPVDPIWESAAPPWYGPKTMPLVAALDYGHTPFLATAPETPLFGVNHAGRRTDLEAIGGFDEAQGGKGIAAFGIGNDADLYNRLLAAGKRVLYDPDMRVDHMVSASRATTAYHRRMIRIASRGYAQYLAQTRPYGRGVAGVPRWMVRRAAEHAWQFVRATVGRRRSDAFYYEIQARRLCWVFWWSLRSLAVPARDGH